MECASFVHLPLLHACHELGRLRKHMSLTVNICCKRLIAAPQLSSVHGPKAVLTAHRSCHPPARVLDRRVHAHPHRHVGATRYPHAHAHTRHAHTHAAHGLRHSRVVHAHRRVRVVPIELSRRDRAHAHASHVPKPHPRPAHALCARRERVPRRSHVGRALVGEELLLLLLLLQVVRGNGGVMLCAGGLDLGRARNGVHLSIVLAVGGSAVILGLALPLVFEQWAGVIVEL